MLWVRRSELSRGGRRSLRIVQLGLGDRQILEQVEQFCFEATIADQCDRVLYRINLDFCRSRSCSVDAARGEDRDLGHQSPNVALAGVRVIHCPQQVMNPIEIAKVLRLNFDLLRIYGQSTSNGRAHLLYLCENSAAEQLSQFAAKSSEQEADRQATDASVVKATSKSPPP
jgi:hypothetical protein